MIKFRTLKKLFAAPVSSILNILIFVLMGNVIWESIETDRICKKGYRENNLNNITIKYTISLTPKKCYFTDHTWITQDPAESRRVSLASTKLTDVMSRLRWQKCTNVIVACSKFKQAGQGNVK